MQKITTFLTFKKDAKKAVEFYTSVFKDSKVNTMMTLPGSDQVMFALFTLNGHEFVALDGGDHEGFVFTDGISLYINCEDQEEVDYYWDALLADGGSESQCGWLKDKFGLSWQVIPKQLSELMGDPDPEKGQRVMQAMLKMQKIDIKTLEEAHKG